MTFFEELRWRGLVQDATEGAEEALTEGPVTAYIGFDPSASSLHVGSLLPIMALVHLQRAGHRPIALVGGGTGLIGDPSGKTEERPLLSKEEIADNLEGIRSQLERFLDFEAAENPARMANNVEWLGSLGVLDFLRETGKHFSVNAMLRKESVRRRLENEETGITYTEFSYQLLQAYDFLALHDRHGCTLQMGGSDQWGNVTAGVDLIRRVRGAKAHGIVLPLVTTASGRKFGKTEAGTVWLDPARTSPYRFYQFWLNVADDEVLGYLRYFTLLSQEEIAALEEEVRERPWAREAQKALGRDVTRRVHGEEGLEAALRATDVLFGGGEIEGLGAAEVEEVFADVPSSTVARTALEGEGMAVADLLAETGVTASKGEAKRALDQGGIYLNNRRVEDPARVVTTDDALEGAFLVLRKGKKRYHLVRVE